MRFGFHNCTLESSTREVNEKVNKMLYRTNIVREASDTSFWADCAYFNIALVPAPVATDANHISGLDAPSPGDVLLGSEDWSRLVYNFRSSPNYASGSSPESTIDQNEMTADLAAFIDSLYSPSCAADFNGDATVDFFDYLDFVAAFADSLPGADFNGDGVVDFFDYLDFVAAFAEGC